MLLTRTYIHTQTISSSLSLIYAKDNPLIIITVVRTRKRKVVRRRSFMGQSQKVTSFFLCLLNALLWHNITIYCIKLKCENSNVQFENVALNVLNSDIVSDTKNEVGDA